MLKSIVMMDVRSDDIAAMERWYYRDHSSEIARRYGPLPARHESYVALDAPEEARRFGYYSFRVTETYWHEAGGRGEGRLLLHPCPGLERWRPARSRPSPTTTSSAGTRSRRRGPCIRWYIMFRYPLGVRPEEGEDWFLNVHAPEVMKQPGLRRFFSTKVRAGGDPPARHVESQTP